eukprot:TRINITY_DN7267_c0_g1_i10.p1 TRINITY_DN7267_c0_g1~~TRINITY_DN7267_c0_g1_i10.p1  ORF type:complete len:105 (-),score=3.04 TRINITY_DN7267_c0_g1_i10:85-399(-)
MFFLVTKMLQKVCLGFGLACHLGVLSNLPTVGIGKNAMRSTEGSLKPLFISTGHRILLNSAIKVVKMCCKYHVPEPIRQADIRSRAYLRKHSGMGNPIRTMHLL